VPTVQTVRYFGRRDARGVKIREAPGFDGPARRLDLTTAAPDLEIIGGLKTQIEANGNLLVFDQKRRLIAEIPAFKRVEVLANPGETLLFRAITGAESVLPFRTMDIPLADEPFTQTEGPFAGNAGSGVIRLTLPADRTYTIDGLEMYVLASAVAGVRTSRLREAVGTAFHVFHSAAFDPSERMSLQVGQVANQDNTNLAFGASTFNVSTRPRVPVIIEALVDTLLLEGEVNTGDAGDVVFLRAFGSSRLMSADLDAGDVAVQFFTDGSSSED
jgi:hypothetical protein